MDEGWGKGRVLCWVFLGLTFYLKAKDLISKKDELFYQKSCRIVNMKLLKSL